MRHPTRRTAMGLAVAGTAGLSGCASLPDLPIFGTLTGGWSRQGEGAVETPDYAVVYAALPGEKHKVAAFDYTNLDPLKYVELEMLGPLASMSIGDRIERTNVYTLERRKEGTVQAETRRLGLNRSGN